MSFAAEIVAQRGFSGVGGAVALTRQLTAATLSQ
jgi:hypothetical protein